MRAQLLRSEQDNELMRIKLEQETAEREKAQKQVRRGCLHANLVWQLGDAMFASALQPLNPLKQRALQPAQLTLSRDMPGLRYVGNPTLQVEMAKRIMFEQQKEQTKEEGGSRRNNRRETWCPGRSGWAPPLPGEIADAVMGCCAL